MSSPSSVSKVTTLRQCYMKTTIHTRSYDNTKELSCKLKILAYNLEMDKILSHGNQLVK